MPPRHGKLLHMDPNPWLDRGVFHWAHQGGAREAPSNTLWAMAHALEVGAHGLEFDVHATRDDEVVLLHDATLQRTTSGCGRVRNHTVAELARFDAAHWWTPGKVDDHDAGAPPDRYPLRGRAPADRDLGIPRLGDLLERYPAVPLTIEVKDKRAVGPLVQLLRDHGRHRDVIVTSFKDSIVRRLRRRAPDLALAPGRWWNLWFLLRAGLGRPPPKSPYIALQLPPRYKWLNVIDRRLLDAAHEAGLAVHVWTIDEEAEMRRLIDLGVDGIMTDRPSVLAAVLEGK